MTRAVARRLGITPWALIGDDSEEARALWYRREMALMQAEGDTH